MEQTKENDLTSQELEAKFQNFFGTLKPRVQDEQVKRFSGYKPAKVVEGLSPELHKVALKLAEIQNQKTFISKKDMEEVDYNYIKVLARKNGVSFKEMVSKLIENERYLSPEEIDVQNICDAVVDIRKTIGKCERKYGGLPINALSIKTRDYLSNKKIKLLLKDKLKIFIETFCSEFQTVKIIDRSNYFYQDKTFVFDEEEIKKQAAQLERFKEDGTIDKLFASFNNSFLTNLLGILSKNRITFDEFISKYTDLNYTRLYCLDTVEAVKQMVLTYNSKFGTFRAITVNDPYLRVKIDTAEKITKKYNLYDFLMSLGIESDAKSNSLQLTPNQIEDKKLTLITTLYSYYPDKVIDYGFIKDHPNLYNIALMLANRLEFEDVDSFLASIGFDRKKEYVKNISENKIILTERDLLNYRFIEEQNTEDKLAKFVEQFGVSLLNVEEGRMAYQKLAYEKNDSSSVKYLQNEKQKKTE